MSIAIEYDTATEEQISAVRKFARNSILIIWIAGTSAILVFIIYFLFLSANTVKQIHYEEIADSKQQQDATLFSDKTTLVNIGLKIQEMSESTEVKSNGSIRIHKINYDQQLKRTLRPTKTDFTVKAIPK